MPAITDTTPTSASTHSLVISRRSRIAATISITPVTSAQAPIRMTSTSAVRPGHSTVTTAAPTPSRPPTICATRCHRSPPPRIPAASIPIPSTRAYAPNSSASTNTVIAGSSSARMPKITARAPRTANSPDSHLIDISTSPLQPFVVGYPRGAAAQTGGG